MRMSQAPEIVRRARVPRIGPVVLAFVACLAARPGAAQDSPANRLRVEAGYSVNHEGDDKGPGGAVRYVRALDFDDTFRLETGLIAGNPYLGLDAGLEFRFPRRTRWGVVLRAGGGLLLEDGFFGFHARGGGGVEFDLNPRLALRATGQAGYHDGFIGPHVMYVGMDYRW